MGSSLPDRQPALDGIRGLAILWVFAFHANALLIGAPLDASSGWAASLSAKGLLGVQLFFVLSGFLLARPWMAADAAGTAYPSFATFYTRRARRIFPTYWLHLALLFGLILPILRGGYAVLSTDIGQTNLWLHIPLLHFLHPGSSSSLGLNMALWSLSIEAQFYLLLPLLAPLFVRNRVLIALPVALLVALLWKTYAPGLLTEWVYLNVSPSRLVFFNPISGHAGSFAPEMMHFFLERQLPGEIMAFAFGMAAANLYTRLTPGGPARNWSAQHWSAQHWRLVLDAAALGSLVVTIAVLIQLSLDEILTGIGWRLLGMPFFLIGCTLLVLAAALRTPLIDRLFAGPILMPIGVISYSLFLWHEPLIRIVATGRLVPGACDGTPCRVALALGLALLVAALSYALTERGWFGSAAFKARTLVRDACRRKA